MEKQKAKPYQIPKLEEHQPYLMVTGVSLPIGTSIPDNFEIADVLGEEQ